MDVSIPYPSTSIVYPNLGGVHSVIFTDPNNAINSYNTYGTWGLIPTSRPVIAQPTPVYKYVEIPGRNGSLDLTDYLVGKPTYSDRKGSFEFYAVENGKSWTTRRMEIASILNGRQMWVTLEDDPPGYDYFGRVIFKDWKSEGQFSRVVIEYQLDPYCYANKNKVAGGVL